MQYIEPNQYIADEGKAFKRVYNGFEKIDDKNFYQNLTLGNIIVNAKGEKLETPIPDKIQYYEEVELPTNEEFDKETSLVDSE